MVCNGDGYGFWTLRAVRTYHISKILHFSAKVEYLTRVVRRNRVNQWEHALECLPWTILDDTCIVWWHTSHRKDRTVHFHHFPTDPVVWHRWLRVLKLEESEVKSSNFAASIFLEETPSKNCSCGHPELNVHKQKEKMSKPSNLRTSCLVQPSVALFSVR